MADKTAIEETVGGVAEEVELLVHLVLRRLAESRLAMHLVLDMSSML